MAQKTYTFPKIGGGEIIKTLALPTNKRIQRAFELVGLKNFSELQNPEGQTKYSLWLQETALSVDKLMAALDCCLEEENTDIDIEDLDMNLSDTVIQDFFEQRVRNSRERVLS